MELREGVVPTCKDNPLSKAVGKACFVVDATTVAREICD
jgi:hypothetical protein